jgi:hypothetical protein
VDTEAKNDARKAVATVARPFIAQRLMFPPVANEDRAAMGVRDKDTQRAPIGDPATRVVIVDVRALGGYQAKLWISDETTLESRAIPYGCDGCLLCFAWDDKEITDESLLTRTKLLTRLPFTLTLPPGSRAEYLSRAATGLSGAPLSLRPSVATRRLLRAPPIPCAADCGLFLPNSGQYWLARRPARPSLRAPEGRNNPARVVIASPVGAKQSSREKAGEASV